jgi:hypothetical protein
MKVLCACSAVAGLVFAGYALAEPVALSDAELADVAAGYYAPSPSVRDGVIVGNAAVADVRVDSTITLDAQAQRQARGVAVVNSAHSDVGNGSNVRDGHEAALIGNVASSLHQSNEILQENPVSGYVADWQLQDVNHSVRKTESFDSEFAGGIIPQVFTFTGNVTTDTLTTTTDSEGNKTTTPSTSTTQLVETLEIGRGVAMAGEVDVVSGAGGIAFSETVDSTVDTTASASFTVGFWKFKYTHSETTTIHVEESGGISGGIELPPYSLQAKGVFCQALIGSCLPYTGRYSSDSHIEETTLIPARLQGASAGRIVMSDGTLQQEIESDVALEGQAQRDLRALHAVNAAGSQVANGANVARGIGATTLPRAAMQLRQNNLITQRQ